MPGEKALTPKQAAFAQAYWERKNATTAYQLVYGNEKTSRTTAARNAHAMLDNPKIIAELDRLKAANTKKVTITIEDLVAEQDVAMQMAKESGNAVAYASASMNKAKLLGMLVDRAEVRTGAIDPDEAKPDIAQLWERVAPKTDEHETKH
jgi:phage terminase small subunit